MAEENNKKKSNSGSKTALKVVVGLVFLVAGVSLMIVCRKDLFALFRGCFGLFLVMIGAITIAIAKE